MVLISTDGTCYTLVFFSMCRHLEGKELDSKNRKFHILEHHVASCQELKQEAERLKEEKEYAEQDLLEWKRNFENLEEESKKLLEERT